MAEWVLQAFVVAGQVSTLGQARGTLHAGSGGPISQHQGRARAHQRRDGSEPVRSFQASGKAVRRRDLVPRGALSRVGQVAWPARARVTNGGAVFAWRQRTVSSTFVSREEFFSLRRLTQDLQCLGGAMRDDSILLQMGFLEQLQVDWKRYLFQI